MLYNLEPSSELSGGAWYSDTELDEAFIEAISNACLRSIQERVLAVLITRSHRYHDHAETDGTQDIASQFAAAYDKEPEPYSHSSARRKARSRFALLKRRIYVHGLKQCTDAVSLLFTPSVYQP
ncbi:unnamed protein product [Tilletia caries]|nr:unnamed protein product [Tilletia caries]